MATEWIIPEDICLAAAKHANEATGAMPSAFDAHIVNNHAKAIRNGVRLTAAWASSAAEWLKRNGHIK